MAETGLGTDSLTKAYRVKYKAAMKAGELRPDEPPCPSCEYPRTLYTRIHGKWTLACVQCGWPIE